MNILGLSGSTHDPAASLISDGKVVAAIEQERIIRKKHAARSLPIEAARAAMIKGNIQPNDIDVIAYFLDPDLFNENVVGHVLSDWRRYIVQHRAYRTNKFLNRGERYRNEAVQTAREL